MDDCPIGKLELPVVNYLTSDDKIQIRATGQQDANYGINVNVVIPQYRIKKKNHIIILVDTRKPCDMIQPHVNKTKFLLN